MKKIPKSPQKVLLVIPKGCYEKFTSDYAMANIPCGVIHLAAGIIDVCQLTVWDLNVAPKTDKEMKKYFSQICPEIIGISAWIDNYPETERLIKFFKKVSTTSKIVVGGPYASVAPEIYKNAGADLVITGEGIQQMRDIITNKFSAIRLDNIDISSVYNLFPIKRYIGKYITIDNCFTIITSYGCRHNCAFCSSHYLGKVVERRLARVKSELSYLKEKYKMESVNFVDASFTTNRERALALAKIAKELKLQWSIQVRADEIDLELAEIIADAGCKYALFGLESLNQELLKESSKGTQLQDINKVIINLRQAGICPIAFVIFGLPKQTQYDAEKVINFAKQNQLPLIPNVLIPIPGTKIWQYTKSIGAPLDPRELAINVSQNYYQQKRAYSSINLSCMRSSEIKNAVRKIQKLNFLKN